MADPKKNPLIGAFRAPVPGSVPPAPTVEEPKPAAPVQIADPKDKAVVTPAGPAEVKKPEEPPKGAESKGKAEAAAPTDPAGAKKPAEPPKGADPKDKAEAAAPTAPAGAKKTEEPPKGSDPKGKAEAAAPTDPAGAKKPEEPPKGSNPKGKAETAAPAAPAGTKKPEELSKGSDPKDKIPSGTAAKELKEASRAGTLTTEKIQAAVAPTKREETPPLKLTLNEEDLRPYFPDKRTTVPDAKKAIFEGLTLRNKMIERQAAKTKAEKDAKKKLSAPVR